MRIFFYPQDKGLIPNDGQWHNNARRISNGIVTMWGDKFNTFTVSCGANSDYSRTGSFYPEVLTLYEAKSRIDDKVKRGVFHH